MRKIITASIFGLTLLMGVNVGASPQKSSCNDTVVPKSLDEHNLMDYLKGVWNVSGSWQLMEGEGKIKKTIKARIVGTETFTPILNGHFLEKDMSATIKYNSRDLNTKVQKSFSAITIFTFNANLSKFFYWYYDCSGFFIDAGGTYNHENKEYVFLSTVVDDNGQAIETMYTLTIVDQDHYNWTSQQKKGSGSDWQVNASGTSTRKHK